MATIMVPCRTPRRNKKEISTTYTEQRTDSIEMYLSTDELMKMLSMSRSTIYRLIDKGLPSIKVGWGWNFAKDKVLAWFEAR